MDDDISGSVKSCNLTPGSKNYSYEDYRRKLEDKWGFVPYGEGAFGSLLVNNNCAIKIIKDINRCVELSQEKAVYNRIAQFIPIKSESTFIPRLYISNYLDHFCHFNLQRLYSPLSGFGDIYEDEETGYGYVLDSSTNNYLFRDLETNTIIQKPRDKVYSIDRAGSLIHFYINHFDKNLKEKLPQDQGILVGINWLEKYFTPEYLEQYSEMVGRALAFLVFSVRIIPNDIEVVLATDKENRVVQPYIYDFNETINIDVNKHAKNLNTLAELVAGSMYSKNGKNYFPNSLNKYYPAFSRGFLNYDPQELPLAQKILGAYNNRFA